MVGTKKIAKLNLSPQKSNLEQIEEEEKVRGFDSEDRLNLFSNSCMDKEYFLAQKGRESGEILSPIAANKKYNFDELA